MSRAFIFLALLCFIGGCHKGTSGDIVPADKLAQSNPNAKAAELLNTLHSLDTDERVAWVQQHQFDLKVFDTVTDPKLKAQYDQDIKPFFDTKP